MAGLRLAEMMRSYEQDLLDEIHFLKEKHLALLNIFLGKVQAPNNITLDDRNFGNDLRELIAYTMEQRVRGITIENLEGNAIPFMPTSEKMHKWILSRSPAPTVSCTQRATYENREQWIQALLVEFNRAI